MLNWFKSFSTKKRLRKPNDLPSHSVEEAREIILQARKSELNDKGVEQDIKDLIHKVKNEEINKNKAKKDLKEILAKVPVKSQPEIAQPVSLEPVFEEIEESQEHTYKDPYVTFIIPSIGRTSLIKTAVSLQNQTVSNWKAIIVYDGIDKDKEIITSDFDDRFTIIRLSRQVGSRKGKSFHSHAGYVRNVGIKKVNTEWIGFVDDDDYLKDRYIETLRKGAKDCDLFVFKMSWAGRIIPGDNNIRLYNVGISFAIRNDFVKKHDLQFDQSELEDAKFAVNAIKCGARHKVSSEILYVAAN